MQAPTIRIDVKPHEGQAEVHKHPARFKVLAAGRRWGKTRLGVNECMDVAARGGRAWWVSPSYKTGEVGWRPLRRLAAQMGAEVRRADRQVIMPSGGDVTVRSADNPDSLRGEGLDFVVFDECAFMREETWTHVIRPSLSDRRGRALFISTPKGRNWFWRLWTQGQDSETSEWQSWRFPTSSNPYISADDIEAARNSLPDLVFRQEYLAEFVDDAGNVIRRVMDAAMASPADPVDGELYIYGVDWGKSADFTVICVLDDNGNMVAFDRFNQIDYAVQVRRLSALAERYPPLVIVAERNSMGEPLVEHLQREGLPVQPFTTTNQSKQTMIDALALAFERGEIKIFNDPVLVSELQAYEMQRLPSGMLRYTAPAGMHDDCVMALALAWSAVADSGPLLLW